MGGFMTIVIDGSGTITGAATLATTVTSPTLTTPVVTTTIGVGGATPSASGSGVTFPATQSASTNANTLDDYEEGTWTPTDGSGAGLTFSTAIGHYTKIGNMVYAAFQVQYPATASGSNAAIGGLPFTTGAYSGTQIFGGFLNYSTIATPFFGLTFPSSTAVFFFAPSATQITNVQLTGGQVRMTVVYQAA